MTSPAQRKQTWKIAAATAGCAAACPLLFWLSGIADQKLVKPASPTGAPPALNVPSLIMMVAVAAGLFAVLGVFWLVVRIRDARTPAWKKPGRKRRF